MEEKKREKKNYTNLSASKKEQVPRRATGWSLQTNSRTERGKVEMTQRQTDNKSIFRLLGPQY